MSHMLLPLGWCCSMGMLPLLLHHGLGVAPHGWPVMHQPSSSSPADNLLSRMDMQLRLLLLLTMEGLGLLRHHRLVSELSNKRRQLGVP